MKNLYEKYLLPRITNTLCSFGPVMKQRAKVVPMAQGRVLEIGAGSGLNFNFYDPAKVKEIIALDPSEEMWSLAQKRLEGKPFRVDFLQGIAEEMPIEDNSVDSILSTYTMCSIHKFNSALLEMRRVLKPGGMLIFCEHGLSPDKSVRKWQNIMNPIWKRLGGGCNLNRDIPRLIEKDAFKIKKLDTMYIPGFKPASYNFWGMAKPR